MCGIVGFVNANSRCADVEVLRRMNRSIIHRGPDGSGFFVDENVGLAMRRLSIIDLKGGQQPIFNEDRTKTIVYNGEIYNFQVIRDDLENRGHSFYTNSDTEVVLHLYDEYGPDCVQFLRGMFAFAIWDSQEKVLFVARDRIGKKPLLYSHQPNGDFVFGSEFRAMLQHPDISRDVDYAAIDSYLSYLCVPAPQTAFRQIRKLEPAHWLRWKGGHIETQRYWLPDFSKKIRITEEDAIEETTRILREATRMRLISDVPIGAFLSGGVDSSCVTALMAESSEKPIKTFSIGFDEKDFSELRYAKQVAKHIGAEYHEFIVRPNAMEVLPTLVEHYGEPYADPSAIPTYYVSRETRRFVTVALNGDGGDESFAGYKRHAAMKLAETYRLLPSVLQSALTRLPLAVAPAVGFRRSRARDIQRFLQAAALPRLERYLSWMSTFDSVAKNELYTREFSKAVSSERSATVLEQWGLFANGSGLLDTILLTDQMTYLPNDLLVKVDIASMANSLEARSPFLDHKVIEFAASLPENLKMRRFETKSLLKKVAARLVPYEAVYRRKMGFCVPVGEWLRREMKDYVRDTLLTEKAFNRGITKAEVVERYVREHASGNRDHTLQIWTLMMLELWFQRFVDSN